MGCGTPAVPLDLTLDPSFKALRNEVSYPFCFPSLFVGYPPEGGDSLGIYIYIY